MPCPQIRAALTAVIAVTACTPRPRSAPGTAAGCRTTVDANGRAASDTVRWRVAVAAPRVPTLDDWCREVGPAVVEPPSDTTVRGLDSVAVVSWNLHVGAADLPAFVRDLRSGRLTGGRPVRHFVILAQEARRSRGRDVVGAARALGLGVFYAPSMRNGPGEPGVDDRGNAILSTLPLAELEAVELPLERQRRVALVARIRLAPGTVPLTLLDVHLENLSGRIVPDRRSTGIGRREQMRALLDAVALDGPVVLAGDLNTWAAGSAEPVVADLLGTHHFTLSPARAREATLVAFFGLFAQRLDYVFFRLPAGWSGHSRLLRDRYGSDHYPLLAWVKAAAAR